MIDSLRQALVGRQQRDGAWSAGVGGPGFTEATALATLALRISEPEASARGAAWLADRQRPDGAWPPSEQVGLSSWTTPLAMLALDAVHEGAFERGVQWLMDHGGRGYPWYQKLFFRLFPEREAVELDPDLKGWPWLPDSFSWVEPTSYAILALRSRATSDDRIALRVDEAQRMLLDRVCDGGGWNYGNSRVLDESLWPYPDTTAIALLALAGRERNTEIDESLSALRSMTREVSSMLSLSLAALCFDLYGLDAEDVQDRLNSNANATADRSDTRSLAFATMALGDGPGALVPTPGTTL